MHSDFSATAKAVRAAIPVPSISLETIRGRSRARERRGRLRMVVACGVLALGAVGAGTVGAKLYNGIQVWLAGNRGAMLVRSFSLVSSPSASDLRTIAAKATFPLVYPVGMPPGTHVIRVAYAPAENPTSVVLQYLNPHSGFHAGYALVDSTAVNATALPPIGSQRPRYGKVRHWRIGGETVIAFAGAVAPGYARAIERAMQTTSAAKSVAENEAMVWNIRVLGGTYQLAGEADRLAQGRPGVLIDRGNLRLIPGLAHADRPLLATRTTSLTNIPSVKGVPQYQRAVTRVQRDRAVPADGVRAIAAVMTVAGESGRWTDCCEILYTAPKNGDYTVWTLPMSASASVRKYTVDARTDRVTVRSM